MSTSHQADVGDRAATQGAAARLYLPMKLYPLLVALGLASAACSRPSANPVPPPRSSARGESADEQPGSRSAPQRDGGCQPSSFERTSTGVAWRVGDAVVEFAETLEWLETESAYNYRRRTVQLSHGEVALASSCYTETDCDVPDDPDGGKRWCLVSHGLDGSATLRALEQTRHACESPLEILEGLTQHSAAPTCFRVALGTYPGAAWEELGVLASELQAQGVSAETLAEIERLAKAAQDADRGYNDPADNAKAAAALEALQTVLAQHMDLEPAWQLGLLISRSLARLQDRYPATLVGPNDKLYDAWFPPEGGAPKITPIQGAWATR